MIRRKKNSKRKKTVLNSFPGILLHLCHTILKRTAGVALMVLIVSAGLDVSQLARLTRNKRQIETNDLFPDMRQAAKRVFPVADILDVVTHRVDFVIQVCCLLVQFFDLVGVMDPEADHDECKDYGRQKHCHYHGSTGLLLSPFYFVR